MPRPLAILLLMPFSALSVMALWQHGYVGIFQHQFANSAGWQVLADLCLSATVALFALHADARASGRAPWPWILATLLLGSLALLAYYATARPRA